MIEKIKIAIGIMIVWALMIPVCLVAWFASTSVTESLENFNADDHPPQKKEN